MKKTIISGLVTILFLSTVATAQFKIKIPKIKKPKVPKVSEKVNKSVGSTKGKNRQMVIDDGFTFFEAKPVKSERIAKYRGYIAKGWTLTGNFRAFGTFPDNSGFKMVVAKNGKALAKYMCVAKVHRKADSPVTSVRNSPDDDYMLTGGRCGGKEKTFVKSPGKYDVQVYAINGDTDEETLLRTYKIDVHEAKKIRPGNVPGVSDFYIQRHAEAPLAILYLRPPQKNYAKPNYHQINAGSTLIGEVDIYINVATTRNRLEFSEIPAVRCFVNGKRVRFLNKGHSRPKAMRGDSAIYARNGKPTEYMGFYNYRVNVPILVKSSRGTTADNQNPSFERYKGDWRCQLRDGMETVRTFKWTIGSDGMPVEHPEQTSGNINLHWGAYLIDMEIPEGGSEIDKSLMPMPNAGMFYGIPYKTDIGKQKAAAVPKKGKPYLTP